MTVLVRDGDAFDISLIMPEAVTCGSPLSLCRAFVSALLHTYQVIAIKQALAFCQFRVSAFLEHFFSLTMLWAVSCGTRIIVTRKIFYVLEFYFGVYA